VHGGVGFGLGSLSPDLDPLARDRVLIYYDQRGGGRSTPGTDSTSLTVDGHLRDLARVIDQLHLAHPMLLGHSWGAGLVVRYAAANPGVASRIVLMEPSPPRAVPYAADFNARLVARASDAELRRYAAAIDSSALRTDPLRSCRAQSAILMRLWGGPDSLSRARVRADLCAMSGDAYRFVQQVAKPMADRSVAGWDLRATAAAIAAPPLIVRGADDPMPVAAITEWATALRDARVFTIGRAGHFGHAERPDVALPAIATFLCGSWPAEAVTPR
jgi:pimeloyl-ACP methyl ester carboxylesterase